TAEQKICTMCCDREGRTPLTCQLGQICSQSPCQGRVKKRFGLVYEDHSVRKAHDSGDQSCECLHTIAELCNLGCGAVKCTCASIERLLFGRVFGRTIAHSNTKHGHPSWINHETQPERLSGQLSDSDACFLILKERPQVILWMQ